MDRNVVEAKLESLRRCVERIAARRINGSWNLLRLRFGKGLWNISKSRGVRMARKWYLIHVYVIPRPPYPNPNLTPILWVRPH